MSEALGLMHPDALIVGAGPAGLSAATTLAEAGVRVLVVERERHAGGIPRHSHHLGYGIRDLRRVVSGPTYVRRLVDRALSVGVQIHTETMVTGWTDAGAALITSPLGRFSVTAEAIVLATGARERPRAARLVPGDRPAGVFTTGQLQNHVHIHHRSPGTRAVVIGAELVSWSAVMTLRSAKCPTVTMTSVYPTAESYAPLTLFGRVVWRVPVAVSTRVVRIVGSRRVEAVEVEDMTSGARRFIECDAVVFTGDWIADSELARLAGLGIDARGTGLIVDSALRTNRPGMFAAGNVIHPVDTADVAALTGRHAARHVRAWLDGVRPVDHAVRLVADGALCWVAPSLIRLGDPDPPLGRLVAWTDGHVRRPRVTIHQSGREIARRQLRWPASPGRAVHIPFSLLRNVDRRSGDVIVRMS